MIEFKTKSEINKIEKAGKITAEILEILADSVKPGMNTLDLENIALREIKRRKVESVFLNYIPTFSTTPYPANVCISVNEEIVHGIPKKNKILQNGDIVSIDLATKLDGFIGDTATTVGVGKISAYLSTFLKIAKQSLFEGVLKCCENNYLGDVGSAIDSYLESHSLHVVKTFHGHGVGRYLHEDPVVPHFGTPKTGLKLEEGLVFTIEPMICQESDQTIRMDDGWTVSSADGKPAAHFEHTITITKNGPEILTKL